MKKTKIIINSKTSGRYHREVIDGRSHIVTQMMPIRGNTSMNNVFYPDKDVEKSFMQLNNLPAPSGHPTVNGVNVLASHPVANNKQNIGGWLRNPRKKGKRVFVDFMLDEEIANNSTDGKETIRRIENGEKIGVSTGLGIAQVINKTGADDFGAKYTREGHGFKFDHVAILLNETAAGEHAGTELITNSEDFEVLTFNTTDDFYNETLGEKIQSVNEAIKELDDYTVSVDDGIIAINKLQPTPKEEVSTMDKQKLVLAIIANSANKFTIKDVDALNAKTDEDLNSIVATNTLDEETAKDFLATNAKVDFDGYETFKTNKVEFEAFMANKALEEKAAIDNIVANSEYTEEMLKGKSAQELTVITNMLKPKTAYRIGEQATQHTNSASKDVVVDFS